jgi:myo-inositol-1(or 4)-monophosphatase
VDGPELRTLVELASAAARGAGALLLDRLGLARTDVGTKSTGTDMVTEMDRAAEQLIVEHLLGARPDDAVLGEEGSDREGSSGVRWIIDPLDGTTNYLYGHPGWCVSIAAEVDGEVAAAAVFDPVHDELFSATAGGGARCNGDPIRPTAETDLSRALVATGFSYEPERRRRQGAVLAVVLPEVRDIRRMGAAAVDLCSVARGRVDAYYEKGLAPWDHAAGVLIAAEAGAVVNDLEGGPASSAFVLAAAPGVATALGNLLREAGAADA